MMEFRPEAAVTVLTGDLLKCLHTCQHTTVLSKSSKRVTKRVCPSSG